MSGRWLPAQPAPWSSIRTDSTTPSDSGCVLAPACWSKPAGSTDGAAFPQSVTSTPFQKATRSRISAAAALVSG